MLTRRARETPLPPAIASSARLTAGRSPVRAANLSSVSVAMGCPLGEEGDRYQEVTEFPVGCQVSQSPRKRRVYSATRAIAAFRITAVVAAEAVAAGVAVAVAAATADCD